MTITYRRQLNEDEEDGLVYFHDQELTDRRRAALMDRSSGVTGGANRAMFELIPDHEVDCMWCHIAEADGELIDLDRPAS